MQADTEILRILADWNVWGEFKADLVERKEYVDRINALFTPRTALVISGIRRSGKSSIAVLYLKRFIQDHNIDPKKTLVINFEDPRFPSAMNAKYLTDIYEVYLQNVSASCKLVILDEIQNVRDWEKFVRYLLEAKNTSVIVTGSSAKLLSTEISTVLTGRYLNIEVFPLSFTEFLSFQKLQMTSKLDLVTNRTMLARLFSIYTTWGGFPEVVCSSKDVAKRELLGTYYESILMKDIVRRFHIKLLNKMEDLSKIFTANISTIQSLNRHKHILDCSMHTLERFASYLELAGLFLYLNKFDYSIAQQTRSLKKVYLIDTGLYTAKGFRFSDNYGRVLENIVAVELARRCSSEHGLELYYWRDYNQREVDFVVKNGKRIRHLIQVCNVSNIEELPKREIESLASASEILRCNDLLVVTARLDTVRKIKGKKIKFIPIIDYLTLQNTN